MQSFYCNQEEFKVFHTKHCMWIFLFTCNAPQSGNNPDVLQLKNEKQKCYICRTECCSALKIRREDLTHAATWINFENIALNERPFRRPWFPSWKFRIGRGREWISECLGSGDDGKWLGMDRASFCSDDKVLKVILVMVAQFCEHTKNH